MKLIYDAKKDGENCYYCHLKCNNVPNTISIITTNEGNKFGFFRSIPIGENTDSWLGDNKAFFISFNKEKIYPIIYNNKTISFDEDYFIQTKCFELKKNILSDKHYNSDKNTMNKNFEGFTEDYELTNGKKEFYIKEFRVYQLNI
jgi:hypothetical protein